MAHPVLALCDAAEAWHEQARSTLTAMDAQIRSTTTDKRLLAPWDHFVRGLKAHFTEEERVLFPALRALAIGQSPDDDAYRRHLEDMAQELGEISTIADALRNAARDAGTLEAGLLEFLDDLEEHAEREQSQLLPAAQTLLGGGGPVSPPRPQADPPAADPLGHPHGRPHGVLRRTVRRLRGLKGLLH